MGASEYLMVVLQVSEDVMSNPTALDCLMNMGETSENVSSEYVPIFVPIDDHRSR